jgi:hypothetical protein
MGAAISSQSTALAGKTPTKVLPRKEKAGQSSETLSATKKKKPDASYELNLSDAAQINLGSALPGISTPAEALQNLNLVKSAVQQSPAALLNLHKPDLKSVMDLLA